MILLDETGIAEDDQPASRSLAARQSHSEWVPGICEWLPDLQFGLITSMGSKTGLVAGRTESSLLCCPGLAQR